MSPPEFAAAMAAVVAALHEPPGSVEETLARITATAQRSIPDVDFASISIRTHESEHLRTVAPTNRLAERLDHFQYELHEGPCYQATDSGSTTVCSGDVRHDDRWPRFGRLAGALGIRSQLAVQIHDNGETIGLNLYSRQVDAFAEPDDLALLFAQHARAALGHAYSHDQMSTGMDHRTDIGIAIGIVMTRYGLSRERAFDFIVRVSQSTNSKVRDVAARIIDMPPGDASTPLRGDD